MGQASTSIVWTARAWHARISPFDRSAAVSASCTSIVTWPEINCVLHWPQMPGSAFEGDVHAGFLGGFQHGVRPWQGGGRAGSFEHDVRDRAVGGGSSTAASTSVRRPASTARRRDERLLQDVGVGNAHLDQDSRIDAIIGAGPQSRTGPCVRSGTKPAIISRVICPRGPSHARLGIPRHDHAHVQVRKPGLQVRELVAKDDVANEPDREQQVDLAWPAAVGQAPHDRHHRRDADAAGDHHDPLGLLAGEHEPAGRRRHADALPFAPGLVHVRRGVAVAAPA